MEQNSNITQFPKKALLFISSIMSLLFYYQGKVAVKQNMIKNAIDWISINSHRCHPGLHKSSFHIMLVGANVIRRTEYTGQNIVFSFTV